MQEGSLEKDKKSIRIQKFIIELFTIGSEESFLFENAFFDSSTMNFNLMKFAIDNLAKLESIDKVQVLRQAFRAGTIKECPLRAQTNEKISP